MKNLDLNKLNVSFIEEEELSQINGGGSGSKNGAYIAGRLVGLAIGGPLAGIYYCGCDLNLW